MWELSAITDVGAALLAQWLDGTTLTICEAAGGSGTVADEAALRSLTALTNRKQTASIVEQSRSGNAMTIKVQFPANAQAYQLQQIGVYAALGSGSPVLLAVYQDVTGISIPTSSTSQEFVFTFAGTIAATGAGALNVQIDSAAYVTQAQFATHTHAATDIDAGVLSVVRGGTGVDNIADLLAHLPCRKITDSYTGYSGTGRFNQNNPSSLDINSITHSGIIIISSRSHMIIFHAHADGDGTGVSVDEDGSIELLRAYGALDDTGHRLLCWYSTRSAKMQANESGTGYQVYVIGAGLPQ